MFSSNFSLLQLLNSNLSSKFSIYWLNQERPTITGKVYIKERDLP